MTSPTDRAAGWIRTHGNEVSEHVLLLVSLGLVSGRGELPEIPPVFFAAVLLLNVFIPRSRAGRAAAWWRRGLLAVPRQAVVAASGMLVGRFAFELPWNAAWFAPLWMGSVGFLRLGERFLRPSQLLGYSRWAAALIAGIPWGRFWPARSIAAARRTMDSGLAGTVTGTAAAGFAAWIGSQLGAASAMTPIDWAAGPLLWLALDLAPFRRWQVQSTREGRILAYGARVLLWAGALLLAAASFQPAASLRAVDAWIVLGSVALGIWGLANAGGVLDFAENFRVLLIGLFSLWLVQPVALPDPIGTDAHWYALTLGDVIAQVRAGVFPVFVGQSEFQFNGSIFPVRIAPLFHHFGILADMLSLRTLAIGAIQNLVLIGLGLAAGWTAYASLAWILPRRRWAAFALAGLYLGCPGVLGLLDNDLYMTWTTVPLVPLVLVWHVRSFREPGWRNLIPLSFWLALLWWGHSPIALWMTTLVGAGQACRIWFHRRLPRSWWAAAAAACVFAAVVLYPVISVLVVTPEAGGSNLSYTDTRPHSQEVLLRQAFPAVFMPVGNGRHLSDFQFGWGLWIAFLLALALGPRRGPFWMVASPLVVLVVLLLPVPGIELLWGLVPGVLRNPTGNWVATRLYFLAAAFTVTIVAVALADRPPSIRLGRWLLAGLFLAFAWTVAQDGHFVREALYIRTAAEGQPARIAPENRMMTRYSYLMFGAPPPYYSHGVVDPSLEERILSGDGSRVVAGNSESLAARVPPAGATLLREGVLTGANPTRARWALAPEFPVKPGERYALIFDFADPSATGVLRIYGNTLSRVYALPAYGEPRSFGSAPGSSPVLPLSTSGGSGDTFALEFIPQEASSDRNFTTFGRYRWIRYTLDCLPVNVRGWIPYRADVTSPSAGWLETPRMFQRGYKASVDGRPAEVRRSSNGLVMVAVPAGKSLATLAYRAPAALLLSYWISFAAVLGGIAWIAADAWRRLGSPSSG